MKKQSSVLDYPKKGLDPAVWDEETGLLRPEHKEHILNKLYSFLISQGYNQFDQWIKDIVIIGSLTSYQYADNVDLDVHVRVDVPKFIELEASSTITFDEDFAITLMDEGWREVLNVLEPEYLKGTDHQIEYYFETEKTKATPIDGIYSLLRDLWLKEPRTVDVDFDPTEAFKDVFEELQSLIDELDLDIGKTYRSLKDVDLFLETVESFGPEHKILFEKKLEEKLNAVEAEIRELAEKGEEITQKRHEQFDLASPENITFKYLARFGYLYILRQLKKLIENDDAITEDEMEKALEIIKEREHQRESTEKIVKGFNAKCRDRKIRHESLYKGAQI